MKILITENQFKMLIENIINEQDNVNKTLELLKKKALMDEWFKDLLWQFAKVTHTNRIVWIDKNTFMEYMKYNKKDKDLWVSYNKIWSYFKSNYSKDNKEILELIRKLAEENLNLWDIDGIYQY